MATETASKPAVPRSKDGAATGARALGNAAKAASREKLRVRERQTAMFVGQLAAQLEDKKPGRIFAVRLTCTRYKSTGTIVFNQRRVRAPMNDRDAEDDSGDDDSDDEGDDGPGLDSGPLTHTYAVSKSFPAAPKGAAGAADAAKKQRSAGGIAVTSSGWQQPRRPAKQPQAKPKQAKPPAADRNAISARGSAKLEPGQLSALTNSVNQISKEVCPGSAFTVTKHLPIDGKQVAVQMLPNCMAAEALRHDPKASGERFKRCFLTGNGAELREMLVPVKPMSLFGGGDDSGDVDMGFDLFDKQ